jgi:hypothetical protein
MRSETVTYTNADTIRLTGAEIRFIRNVAGRTRRRRRRNKKTEKI